MQIRPFRDWPLKRKLTALALLTAGAALTMLYVAIILVELVTGWQEMVRQMSLTTETVARNARSALVFDDRKFATQSLQVLSVQPSVYTAVLYQADGSVLATYSNPRYPQEQPLPFSLGARQGFEAGYLVVVHPIRLEGEVVGVLSLRAGLREYMGRLAGFALIALLLLLLSSLATYPLWNRLQHLVLDSVQSLVGVVRKVSEEGDYSLRARSQGRDELGQLISGFNGMLSQIQARDQALEESHRDLEVLVEARTRDLVAANRSLERAKQQAEAANRAKSLFLANMSHEIRTPMNAILGFSRLTQETTLSATQQDYIDKILTSANALLGIIDDILDFSKIEADKLKIEQVDFDLHQLLEEVCHLLQVKAGQKGLELLLSLPAQLPRMVVGDPLRLRQILSNLIGNAIKFTESGDVLVAVEPLREGGDGAGLRFSIRDTGIGMSAEQQAELFQPFTQADISHTRRFGGTGLGLAISKRLVELMDGEIGIESRIGEGSTFSFSLPLLPSAIAQESWPDSRLAGLQVLLVDSHPASRAIVREMLCGFDIQVTLAGSGSEALLRLRSRGDVGAESSFDLVLMDYAALGRNDAELLRAARSDSGGFAAPLLLMCEAMAVGEAHSILGSGTVAGVLSKPLSPASLHDAMLEVCLGEARRSSSRLPDAVARRRGALLGARVLLVEDDLVNQRVAEEFLKGFGLEVVIAGNGREALERVAAASFDVVLMDVHMPVLDGLQATREMREREELQELPIVAMTADAMESGRERCLAAGMDDFLSKPIDPQTLFEVLTQWIEKEQAAVDAASATWELAAGEAISAEEGRELSANLPSYLPGIDLSAGLRRLGGDAAFYHRLLLEFRSNYQECCGELQDALVGEDRAEARRLVHNVKGISSNLGAKELYRASLTLDEALAGEVETDKLIAEFQQTLTTVVNGLERL